MKFLDTNCDHQRAVEIWVSSFDKSCFACPCDSYEDLLEKKCASCRRPNPVGYYAVKPTQTTKYYQETTANAPFCLR